MQPASPQRTVAVSNGTVRAPRTSYGTTTVPYGVSVQSQTPSFVASTATPSTPAPSISPSIVTTGGSSTAMMSNGGAVYRQGAISTSPQKVMSVSSFPRTLSNASSHSVQSVTRSIPSLTQHYRPAMQTPLPRITSGVPVKQKSGSWTEELQRRMWPAIADYVCSQTTRHLKHEDPNVITEDLTTQMKDQLAQIPMPNPITAAWLNEILKIFWPVLGVNLEQTLKKFLLPVLRAKLQPLEPFTLEKCQLGKVPPELSEVQVLENGISDGWVDLFVHAKWHSDANLALSCKLGTISLPSFTLGLPLYISLHGLMPHPPFVRGLSVYMSDAVLPPSHVVNTLKAKITPYFGINLQGSLRGIDQEVINDAVLETLNGTLEKAIVLPNRIPILLAADADHAFNIVRPQPKGCLKISVLGVSNLIGTEWQLSSLVTGKKSNDPYVTVDLAGLSSKRLRTSTKFGNLEPTWEEDNTVYFLVDVPSIQHINLRVYDDGLAQTIRSKVLGTASDSDEMARKLSVSILELIDQGSSSTFLDKEIYREKNVALDSWWDGNTRGDKEELLKAGASMRLGIHWRPVSAGLPANPNTVEEEIGAEFPSHVLRVGIANLVFKQNSFAFNDLFQVVCTVTPTMNMLGDMVDEPLAGVTVKKTAQQSALTVTLKSITTEDTAEVLQRVANNLIGKNEKDACFDEAFDFLIQAPHESKVLLQVFTVPDFDADSDTPTLIGQVVKELGPVLIEPQLVKHIDEELDEWTGSHVPAKLNAELKLWPITKVAAQGIGQDTSPKVVANGVSAQEREMSRQQARKLHAEAARLRAQAEEIEKSARLKDRMTSKQKQAAKQKQLKVQIVGARGLPASDWHMMGESSSDPYCTCTLVGNPKILFKTKALACTLDPVWEHEAKVTEYKPGASLNFQVYDEDWGLKDDLLGEVMLHATEFYPDGFSGELKLQNTLEGKEAYLEVKISNQEGEFPKAFKDASGQSQSKLKVRMLGARGLPAVDRHLMHAKSSDPFCQVQVPGKPRSLSKSQVLEMTLEPLWNHEIRLREYKPGDKLNFGIFDDNWNGTPTLLGKVALESAKFHPQGFAGEVKLEESPGAAEAYLEIVISNESGKYPDYTCERLEKAAAAVASEATSDEVESKTIAAPSQPTTCYEALKPIVATAVAQLSRVACGSR